MHDIRLAFRQLTKSPGFTLVAVTVLGLGLGASTALFSVINSVFLRPLPYPEPDRLVRLSSTDEAAGLRRIGFSHPRFLAVRDGQQVFSHLAVGAFNGFTVTGRGDPHQVQGFHASADYLPTLGLQPHLGRNFSADEDRPGGAPVVLVSHRYWRNQLGGDPGVVGQALVVDGRPHTVIGVLPESLSAFPLREIGLWLPRPAEVGYLVPAQLDNGAFAFQVIARLQPGVTLEQARRQVEVLAAGYRRDRPANVDAPTRAEVVPLLEDLVGEQRRTYLLLFGAVACVLLIACANVANLLLARFAGRRREIALRFALGARRGHVVRQLLVESTAVALAGGGLGLLLCHWTVSALPALAGDLVPRAVEISVDGRALAFAVAAALATGVAMGLLPALQASAADVHEALKDATRGSSGGRPGRLRATLLVGEIAVSLVLLVAAGLLLASFARLQRVSPGFEPSGVLVVQLALPPAKYQPRGSLEVFYRELHARLAALPGARSAALGDRVPLTGNTTPAPVAVGGRPLPPMSDRALANRHLVSPGFFATLGIPLRAGRDFDARDRPGSPEVAIVNETFARQHFPGEDPLGRVIVTGMGQRPAQVVGVVGDIRATNLHTPPAADYYLPALQRPENFTAILVRTAGDPAGFVGSVRAALHGLDPDLPLLDPQPLPALVARTFADRQLALVLLGAFAALALILAGVGVYSVMACIVSQRTVEIGIRMALGANAASVRGLVLGQGLRLAAAGVLLGTVAALGVGRLMQSALFEIQPHDPLILGGLAALLLLIAASACYLPARRATRVDPIVALRAQ